MKNSGSALMWPLRTRLVEGLWRRWGGGEVEGCVHGC
jgi:hypothetical protein